VYGDMSQKDRNESIKHTIASGQKEIEKLEPQYRQAKAAINSEGFKNKERDTLLRLAGIVMAFKDDDPPHKAVAIIVRCQEAIKGVEPLYKFVAVYEEKRDRLDRIAGIMGQR